MTTLLELFRNSGVFYWMYEISVFVLIVALSYVVLNLLLSIDKIKLPDKYSKILSILISLSLGIFVVNHSKVIGVFDIFFPFYSYIIIVVVLSIALSLFVSQIAGINSIKNKISYAIIGIVSAIMIFAITINYIELSEATKSIIISPVMAAVIIYAILAGIVIAVGRLKAI